MNRSTGCFRGVEVGGWGSMLVLGGLLSSPSAQLCLLFQEHFSFHLPKVCALSWVSGTWPPCSLLW